MALRSWQRRSSSLSRYALLAYLLIVIDASLYPFGGWRDLGWGPYDYLSVDWPARILAFDALVNGLGYLPLGFVSGLALHPRLRGAAAVVVVTASCVALSIHLEALQTYLPARVASKVDVLTNAIGAFVGVLVAVRFAHALLDRGRLRIWRTRWFAVDASRGLLLVMVWFGALVYPDAFVLGMGGLLKVFDPAASDVIAAAVGLVDDGDAVSAATRFGLAEAVVAGLGMLGSGLLFVNLFRDGVRRSTGFLLLSAFVAATLGIEVLARAVLVDNAGGWPPLTPGARSGIGAAALVLVVAPLLPSRTRWALAVASILGAIVLVNIYPDNPYSSPVGPVWTRGKLLNFYGLASGLNLVWPYLAIVYLLRHDGSPRQHRAHRTTASSKAPAPGSPL